MVKYMAYSIAILGSVAAKNIDSLNKTAKYASAALENGNVVVLGDKSTAAGESDVFVAGLPATATLTTDIYYMVYEAPIPVTASKYKGLTDDPREFNIAAGAIFNCYRPFVGDEIVLSEDGIAGEKSTNTYIAPANGTGELTWAANTTGASLAYKLEGATVISVGNERVTSYKFTCVKAV
jgi:hypothetical protein